MQEDIQQGQVKRRLEQGQGLMEYALLLSLVALVCLAILTVLGRTIGEVFTKINCNLDGTAVGCECINEQLTVTGTCVGVTLVANVSSNCDGAMIDIEGYGNVPGSGNVNWASAPICTGGATSMKIWSYHPDGSYKQYSASPS